jgi:hypothetical protein
MELLVLYRLHATSGGDDIRLSNLFREGVV